MTPAQKMSYFLWKKRHLASTKEISQDDAPSSAICLLISSLLRTPTTLLFKRNILPDFPQSRDDTPSPRLLLRSLSPSPEIGRLRYQCSCRNTTPRRQSEIALQWPRRCVSSLRSSLSHLGLKSTSILRLPQCRPPLRSIRLLDLKYHRLGLCRRRCRSRRLR